MSPLGCGQARTAAGTALPIKAAVERRFDAIIAIPFRASILKDVGRSLRTLAGLGGCSEPLVLGPTIESLYHYTATGSVERLKFLRKRSCHRRF